jgi:hypothetical protein
MMFVFKNRPSTVSKKKTYMKFRLQDRTLPMIEVFAVSAVATEPFYDLQNIRKERCCFSMFIVSSLLLFEICYAYLLVEN